MRTLLSPGCRFSANRRSFSIIDRPFDMFTALAQSFGSGLGPVQLIEFERQTDRTLRTIRLLPVIQAATERLDSICQIGLAFPVGGGFVINLKHERHNDTLINQNSMCPQLPPDPFLPLVQSSYLKCRRLLPTAGSGGCNWYHFLTPGNGLG